MKIVKVRMGVGVRCMFKCNYSKIFTFFQVMLSHLLRVDRNCAEMCHPDGSVYADADFLKCRFEYVFAVPRRIHPGCNDDGRGLLPGGEVFPGVVPPGALGAGGIEVAGGPDAIQRSLTFGAYVPKEAPCTNVSCVGLGRLLEEGIGAKWRKGRCCPLLIKEFEHFLLER